MTDFASQSNSEARISGLEPTHDNMELDEGDDELVAELPVYLSTTLADHLYLFQYPLRNVPFLKNGPTAARMKPNAKMVELDLPLNTRSSHYSTERGEDFAMGMNDKAIKTAYDRRMEEHEEEKMGRFAHKNKEEELLDKITMTSTNIPVQTNYLVGVIHENEVHLTPLNTMIQMRPGLTYIDKIDQKYKDANKRIQDVEKQEEEAKTGPSQSKAQAVQLSAKNSGNEGTARRNLYSMAVRNADEEAWQAMAYYDEHTIQAESVFPNLYSKSREALSSNMTHMDYLDRLSGIKKEPSE
ncbi:DNA-directed RNA polymerase III subunit Rpc5 [Radiomyces spectabilis]|uniref:DNA-directed RNA polymerase III subunit Rpc5 n=1 Tax=Radiomyces spectabilis TaxID=64574 RepID=UPI00221E4EE1|nr:DNA-directed RNA polymerase III subunit Rpc5 [Radiomyces spectabilis]KAI8380966.1 DNA-directed RNA polymerase III subunit Rpc5 [Radiomyces spectabilis]